MVRSFADSSSLEARAPRRCRRDARADITCESLQTAVISAYNGRRPAWFTNRVKENLIDSDTWAYTKTNIRARGASQFVGKRVEIWVPELQEWSAAKVVLDLSPSFNGVHLVQHTDNDLELVGLGDGDPEIRVLD